MKRISKIKYQKVKIICLLVMSWWLMGYSAEPPSVLKITIPDYKVTKGVEVDYVSIPDGEMLTVEEGRPKVPYLVRVIDYPKGYRVQSVAVKERAGLKTATGLRLPVVILNPHAKMPIAMKEGTYPEKEYEWRLWDNPDGTSTLVVTLYPFYYDPKTTSAKFYTDYQVDINYVKTTASITELTTDKTIYEPNEKVKIIVKTANTGKAKDVPIRVKIRKYGSDETVDSLPPRLLKKLSDHDSLTLEWQAAGFPPLDYYAEVFLNDDRLNILDRKQVSFYVGSAVAEITKFSAEPQHFRVGDKIDISLDVKNTGTREISGDCIFRIQENGKIIKDLSQNVTILKPGGLLSFKDTWDTKETEKGKIYDIVGYVRYDGMATEPRKVIVSTNLMPAAKFTCLPEKPVVGIELSFDAAGSKDADGNIVEYNWDFGDGETGSGNKVTHSFSLPGDYETTLTVRDNENGAGQMTQKITVGEEKK
jgi:hypothetical protein